MSATVANVERLPAHVRGSRALGWWGVLLLVVIEIAVFSTLIVTYYYLFSDATVWPPDGISPPDLLLPSINFVLLMAISIPVVYADRAIGRDDQIGLKLAYVVTIIMGIIFLILKYIEYSGLDYQWDTNAYSSIVWTITGFHSVHVAIVVLKTATILALSLKGYFSARRMVAIQGNTLYWLFVIAVWIPLFATLYLFPNFA
jgi:cytochrome c oxidase subunit III